MLGRPAGQPALRGQRRQKPPPHPRRPGRPDPRRRGDTLLGVDSPIAYQANQAAQHIWRGGRSAGVSLIFAGQRGIVSYTGSRDIHANAGNKIMLRVNQPGEMNNIVPGWELAKMPDMSSYADDTDGVALVVDPRSKHRAGRVADLSDLDAVGELARRRGRPDAALPAAIAAQLSGYPTRHDSATAAPTGTARARPSSPCPRPAPAAGSPAPAPRAAARGQAVIARLTGDLVTNVDAALAGMPAPPASPVSLADLPAVRQACHGRTSGGSASRQTAGSSAALTARDCSRPPTGRSGRRFARSR